MRSLKNDPICEATNVATVQKRTVAGILIYVYRKNSALRLDYVLFFDFLDF